MDHGRIVISRLNSHTTVKPPPPPPAAAAAAAAAAAGIVDHDIAVAQQ
jgi:hypothetical protein